SVIPLWHVLKAALSSLHLAPWTPDSASDCVHVNAALVLFVSAFGPERFTIVGGTVSTVQLPVSIALGLPALSVTCTENVCAPLASPFSEMPLWHVVNAALSSL